MGSLQELEALLQKNGMDSNFFNLDHLAADAVNFKRNIEKVQSNNPDLDLAPVFSHNQTRGESIK